MKIEDIIHANFQDAKHKALINIRYTNNWMLQKQNEIVGAYDLSMPQFNILRILRGAKSALNVNTMKERMLEKSPNTTRLLDKLVEKSFVKRCACQEDRRVLWIEITTEGLSVLQKIDDQSILLFPFTENITTDEAEQLSIILDKLRG
jgi:MarR family 2-MHQ and catechol resistance regulon transcriptional repressor